MSFVIGGIVVAGFAAYQLGLFDRPAFRYYEKLVDNKDQSYLIAILAFSSEKKIGKHISRLLNGVSNGIIQSTENHQVMMKSARKLITSSGNEEGTIGIGK